MKWKVNRKKIILKNVLISVVLSTAFLHAHKAIEDVIWTCFCEI